MKMANGLLALVLMGTAAGCTAQPGFDSPEGVVLLARASLAADDFSVFESTLISEAYLGYANPRGFEELKSLVAAHPEAKATSARYTGTTHEFWFNVRHHEMTIGELATVRIDCEMRIYGATPAMVRPYCRIGKIELRP